MTATAHKWRRVPSFAELRVAMQRRCWRKVRHDTEEQAHSAAARMIEQGRAIAMHVYPCRECRGYHTTSMPQ